MTRLAPHLLLCTEGPSHAAELLGAGGYIVSRADDALTLLLAGAPHIDGTVIDLPIIETLRLGRELESRYGGANLVIVVISSAAETVRRALPSARVLTARELDDDLVSVVDLAIASRQMRMTG
jgi:hypothetical protein